MNAIRLVRNIRRYFALREIDSYIREYETRLVSLRAAEQTGAMQLQVAGMVALIAEKKQQRDRIAKGLPPADHLPRGTEDRP